VNALKKKDEFHKGFQVSNLYHFLSFYNDKFLEQLFCLKSLSHLLISYFCFVSETLFLSYLLLLLVVESRNQDSLYFLVIHLKKDLSLVSFLFHS